MKNSVLKKNLKYFIENVLHIESISKGSIGGISIEILTKDPPAFDSYLYKDKQKRDEDFEEFTELTNNLKQEKNESIRNQKSLSESKC